MPDSINSTTITTHEKAVQINLDKRFYGTFAEIGAGQEVARWPARSCYIVLSA